MSGWAPPELVRSEPDPDCGCPEEEWEAFGVYLFVHLNAGKPSDIFADGGEDYGEQETQVTAPTVDEARRLAFDWAAGFYQRA